MRTSNKILLGTLLTAVFLISAIHIALYAKYKSGNYTTLKAIEEDNFNHHSIDKVSRVVAIGLENVNIIPSDATKLDIEKSKNSRVRFEIKDGTLTIRGDSVFHDPGRPDYIQRSYEDINIYLSTIEKITVDNSIIRIEGSKDSSSAKSYELDLQNESSFDFHDNYYTDSSYHYFKSLLIRSDDSEIGLTEYCHINQLQIELQKSEFHDNNAWIGKLTIKPDSISKINIQGINFQKAELIK